MLSNLFSRIKRKTGLFFVHRESDDDAKKYLNKLREQELSIGAAFNRGEIVKTAPRQIRSNADVAPRKTHQTIATTNSSLTYDQKTQGNELAFATSLAVTMATDSPILGYAAGGSLSGAAVGAILSECSSKDDD